MRNVCKHWSKIDLILSYDGLRPFQKAYFPSAIKTLQEHYEYTYNLDGQKNISGLEF